MTLAGVTDHTWNEVYRWAEPVNVLGQIASKCINTFSARVPKARVKTWQLGIIITGKSVNGVGTPSTVQLFENSTVQAPIIIVNNMAHIIC